MMYYAIMHDDDKVIAEAHTFKQCQIEADETKIWDMAPGTVAPYCITTLPPVDCSNCGGSGSVTDGYDNYTCKACEGTGYSINRRKEI